MIYFFVDDDPAIRRSVANDLEDLGCKVSCFADATNCLEQLPKQNFNLLIADEAHRNHITHKFNADNLVDLLKKAAPMVFDEME